MHKLMNLNLKKLCVGVQSISDLSKWQDQRIHQGEVLCHVTRAYPKRSDEILEGGSLYWVILGVMCVRQTIEGFEQVETSLGRKCKIILAPQLVRVEAKKHRPFQGWRYLEAKDTPKDIGRWYPSNATLSPELQKSLLEIGILDI